MSHTTAAVLDILRTSAAVCRLTALKDRLVRGPNTTRIIDKISEMSVSVVAIYTDSQFGEIVVAYVTMRPYRQASLEDLKEKFGLDSG